MKNKFILFSLLLFLLFINEVNAISKCTQEDYLRVKKEANLIKISYDIVEKENSLFDYYLIIENMADDLLIEIKNKNKIITPEFLTENSNKVLLDNSGGNYDLKVIYNNCDRKFIKTIKVKTPIFNFFSQHSKCKNIKNGTLNVCNKFVEKEIEKEEFFNTIKLYEEEQEKIKEEKEKDNSTLNKIINFFIKNYIYILISILFLLVIFSYIFIKKKRNVLE